MRYAQGQGKTGVPPTKPAEIPFQRNRAEEPLRSQNRSLPQIMTDARCFDAPIPLSSSRESLDDVPLRIRGKDDEVIRGMRYAQMSGKTDVPRTDSGTGALSPHFLKQKSRMNRLIISCSFCILRILPSWSCPPQSRSCPWNDS